MMTRGERRHPRVSLLAGFVVGALTGATILSVGSIGAAHRIGSTSQLPLVERGLRDVLHTPPLLIEEGEPVTLQYDVVCQADTFGKPCALEGDLFIRARGDSEFTDVSLGAAGESKLFAAVPARLTTERSLEYYAVVRSGSGESLAVPEGGASTPQRAWTVSRVSTVHLGAHTFGQPRPPDRTIARAEWGPDGVGVLTGRGQATIGPSAFDVGPDGSVVLLDQVNKRLAVYSFGAARPSTVPIPFTGAEGDVTIGDDGSVYVLDQGGSGEEPTLRAFTPAGEAAGLERLTGRGVDMVRAGPGGAFVHAYPGDMWLALGQAGRLIDPSTRPAAARAGRSIPDGGEIVVHGTSSEALLALVRGDRVVHAWRVASDTGLGEIQLVEPFGSGLLAVLRVWTEARAEFVVLRLTPAGLGESFAVEAVEWAESAALGRFRLHDGTLYQLRSTDAGPEIVIFALGGAR